MHCYKYAPEFLYRRMFMLMFGIGFFTWTISVMACMSFMKVSALSDRTATKLFENMR